MMNDTENNLDVFLLEFLEENYHIEQGSPLWNAAALLLRRLWQGSVCVSMEDLTSIIPEFNKGCLRHEAVGKGGETRPLIFDGGNLYIQRYYVYQSKIIYKIETLVQNKKFHIITGGPGTGKTTSLADILKITHNEKVLLAAPTGKAAARMKESLARQGIGTLNLKTEPKTLHRLLGYRHLSVNFRHNAGNPLDAGLIAIDECSMVDLPMMAKLLDAVPDACDIYLLGDKNQLASVEAGSVFADICAKYKNTPDVYDELKVNFRAKDAPGIDLLSKQILAGNQIEDFNNDNVRYIADDIIEALAARYRGLFSARTPKEALDALKTIQILCATKKGRNGAEMINKRFAKLANSCGAIFTPIIISANDYGQNLFNGDTGVRDDNKAYFFTGGETEIQTYPALTLPEHDTAFAITIHKSQGSEYDCAAVVYPEQTREDDGEAGIFTKELLYTAITRAKKEALIFGGLDVLKNSLEHKIIRASGIAPPEPQPLGVGSGEWGYC